MIEVFKTNVQCPGHASRIVEAMLEQFSGYHANFDLSDCDRILRVVAAEPPGQALIEWLKQLDCDAEILPD